MKCRIVLMLPLLSVVIGCSPLSNPFTKKNPTEVAAVSNAYQCQSQARKKLSLFDRPDTYPISKEEKDSAYQALYSQCMKTYDVQIASPKPGFELASNTSDLGLANLSPAAGGTQKAPTNQAVTTLPNGTIVINTAQLGNLSPAAGGNTTAISSSISGTGSTVVVVQAPPSTAIAYPAAPTRPAAIAVERTTTPTPTTAAQPKALINAESAKQHKKPRQSTQKSIQKAPAKTDDTADTRTRFQKNATPVIIDIPQKKGDLNTLQPSAGLLLDHVVTTNRPPAKD